uniref:Uncharacterized protein n=1 Tax=Helicotheca tamesis TaxID=374047 RepID=A0A7S2HE09_9STRA|mmetsp:Transcript_1730/g.2517  ORF Transcript_1730/g.2517 Transcript_1730/m.2517 type:complete len:223 (+) Transcript_1730:65-733(+)
MSLRRLFIEHRNSFVELNNEHEEERNDLQDRIDELELELEFEKSRRIDAVSYASSMKQTRLEREESISAQQERASSPNCMAEKMKKEADKVEKMIMEKYETEKALRQELKAKDEMIKDLKHTVADQDKLISQIRNQWEEISVSSKKDVNQNGKTQIRRKSLDDLMARLQSLPETLHMLEEISTDADVKDAKESGMGASKKEPDDCANLYPHRCSSNFSLRED